MAILPISNFQDVTINRNIIEDRGANFLFDFNKGDFVLKDGKPLQVVGDASVIFWIEKTLRTDFERAEVYKNTGYGFGIESYIGVALPESIIKVQFENDIKNTLLQHQRIKSITEFTLTKVGTVVEISFVVELNAVTEIESDIFEEETEDFTRLATLEDIQKFLSIRLLTSNLLVFKTSLGGTVYVG